MANAKYWSAIMYEENMVEDWRNKIYNLLQVPFSYCLHDKDLDKDGDCRVPHVHLIIAFPNTTTRNNALNVFSRLSAPGKNAFSTFENIIHIRNMYDYIIHATEKARADGKYQYDPSDRINGNNFDIGAFEQISVADKNAAAIELCNLILSKRFTNFIDFYHCAMFEHDNSLYFECIKTYSGLFERLIKGNYNKFSNKKDSSE